MSEEQHTEDTEVEAHGIGKVDHPRFHANDEPRDEAETDDDVEDHLKVSQPKHS